MPPAGANAYAAYRKTEVETLTQRDLIIKLYQGSERFLCEARLAIENNEIEAANEKCQKAKRIFMELLSTLNFDQGGEIANQLRDLYLFVISTIVEANLRKDASKIGEVLGIVATLREAWEQVPAEEANTTSSDAEAQRGRTLNIKT